MTEKDYSNNNKSSLLPDKEPLPFSEGNGKASIFPGKFIEEKYSKKTDSLKNLIDLVKYPVITEKTASLLSSVPGRRTENTQYTFDVDKRLTKPQIKQLFESVFKINVLAVNTHIPPRKTVRVGITRGYRPLYKRAIITLQPNQTIHFASKLAFPLEEPLSK